MSSTKRTQSVSAIRRVTVPSFAKLNLDLRVLHKRPDGYHELRTIFQTISLHDTIHIEFERSRRTQLSLDSSIDIPDNLVIRAARAVLDQLRISASVRFRLIKRIPMGAGLGGGSSNAAAVLLSLPALAGKSITQSDIHLLASQLGSDVPFFLFGGTALGIGRGTELYPLPDQAVHHALVVASSIHVSTAQAYGALNRPLAGLSNVTNALTSEEGFPILREFQAVVWGLDNTPLAQLPLTNDFEPAVFAAHPVLGTLLRKLRRSGAASARMTGSGSAVFGIFASAAAAKVAAAGIPESHVVQFVTRRTYREQWRRALER